MIGKKVRIIRGPHTGETGEVVDSTTFAGIKEPVYRVWLGGTDSALCCEDEMEVIVCK